MQTLIAYFQKGIIENNGAVKQVITLAYIFLLFALQDFALRKDDHLLDQEPFYFQV